MEISPSAPVRVCLFGAAPDARWLSAVTAGMPSGVRIETLSISGDDANSALRAAAAAFPGDDLVLLRSGTTLPAWWYERLTRALGLSDVLCASPLDNIDPARAPLPAGMRTDTEACAIDALCYACGARLALDWPTFSPLLSAWNGKTLRGLDLEKIQQGSLPAQIAPHRGVLLDQLYVADPARALLGPPLPAPGADPEPASALGELRERVAVALPHAAEKTGLYPGLDGKPVVLHILHGWGGGAERFVRDLAGVDDERHHLVLTARGNFGRRRYGEVLELRDDTLTQPPLRQLHLSDPIASTSFGHRSYTAFLAEVVRDFSVNVIMLSSLIGHSLDALRTGLPTVLVGHDYYPLWPLLHRDFGDTALSFDAAQCSADLANAGADFEFAERDPDYWLALRTHFVTAALQAQARIAAPSRSMLANLLRLAPELSTLPQSIIPHGLAPWPKAVVPVVPILRPRLRLVVVGRVRRGKGAQLLRAVLPHIREHAEIFLLGAGAEGADFFGQNDVHIVLNYRREQLPTLLAQIAPDAALLLSSVAETFSYTLSELSSLGIPAIATRLGALGERIRDGVDGFLVAADASAIVATVARLRADRGAIARARAALAQIPQRTLVDMAADYRKLLSVPAQAVARYRLTVPTSDRTSVQTLHDELGASQRRGIALDDKANAQQRELDKRADWAMGLEQQVKRGATALKTLQGEFDERSAWALTLSAEREQLLASVSWRVTKPMRFAMRKLRALRIRLAFTAGRVRAAIHRTRGSLASRGLIGTLRRAADEFRRSPSLPQPLMVPLPSEDFSAFALPTSEQPLVSIVIPVYNKIAYTAACLRSLADHAGSVPFQIIVVDDASTDATAQRLGQIGGISIVRNAQNLGFVGSCNAGADSAKGEFILFLNNDTVVTAGWLEALLQCFAEEPDCGLVGAKLVYPDGRLQEAGGIVFADGSGWNYGRLDDPADPRYNFRREADYCSGAAILLRRDLFVRLGKFDTRYAPAYYEDTDLAFAVRASGKKVFYEPRAIVVHFEGVTAGTDTNLGMKRFQVINRDKFLQKWKNELVRQPAPIVAAALATAAASWRARSRLLIVDACTPMPDHDSGSLRMLNLMRVLREAGFAVSFLPDNRAHDGRYTQALQALGIEALYHPFVADPIGWLRERGRGLDAIVLSRHYVAANYVALARQYAPQAKLIFDTVDLHYLRERRAAQLEGKPELAEQSARTQAQEFKLMRECDVSLVVSSAEKELLAQELPQARIEVLSNVHEVYGRRREFAARRDLVFVGGFQHPPNTDAVLWFVREIFPLVRQALPDIVFHVIGSKAPAQILDLAHDGVLVHGFVPDIAPYMDGCRLALAPLRYGAGVKGKVNMAMSYGLPVVATNAAVEGMHVRNGEDVLVAESPADFCAAILHAYNDATVWKKLSANGLDNVRRHFSFDAARAALLRILPAPRTRT